MRQTKPSDLPLYLHFAPHSLYPKFLAIHKFVGYATENHSFDILPVSLLQSSIVLILVFFTALKTLSLVYFLCLVFFLNFCFCY